MSTVLITGASRGLGLEFAAQYAADGYLVHAACRDPDEATALRAVGRGVRVHRMDVTSPAEVTELARLLQGEPIDLLINNAGVFGPRDYGLGHIDFAAWERVLRINTLAPLRVAETFVDHVARGDLKRMAFITSRLGSIAENAGGGYIYKSSKAALNAAVRSLAGDLGSRRIVAVVIHPGWVQTDMGGANATLRPAESVASMRRVLARLTPDDNGRFFNYDGGALPW
jgi:NAD(P)-dependent dehydrogenase (short-subunit alcohol dehydrogenase family)